MKRAAWLFDKTQQALAHAVVYQDHHSSVRCGFGVSWRWEMEIERLGEQHQRVAYGLKPLPKGNSSGFLSVPFIRWVRRAVAGFGIRWSRQVVEDGLTWLLSTFVPGTGPVAFLSWAEMFELDSGAEKYLEKLGMSRVAAA